MRTLQNSSQTKLKLKVHEIFASYQGEGLFVGEKQIFFRFSRCNMECVYCDTDNSVETRRPLEEVITEIERLYWREGSIQSLSLTGGEPLLYPKEIPPIADCARKLGLKVFLETNATLPRAFDRVQSWVDVVSVDIKLPSVSHTPSFWNEHEAFLKRSQKKICYIKIVLSDEADSKEFSQAIELIAKVNSQIPLILQPVTPLGGVPKIKRKKLDLFYDSALSKLWDVRIQPQWHKIWKIK